MDDDAPLAVPLFDETSPKIQTSTTTANKHPRAESPSPGGTNGDVDGHTEAVGITMITGYLGAGKTTVSDMKSVSNSPQVFKFLCGIWYLGQS